MEKNHRKKRTNQLLICTMTVLLLAFISPSPCCATDTIYFKYKEEDKTLSVEWKKNTNEHSYYCFKASQYPKFTEAIRLNDIDLDIARFEPDENNPEWVLVFMPNLDFKNAIWFDTFKCSMLNVWPVTEYEYGLIIQSEGNKTFNTLPNRCIVSTVCDTVKHGHDESTNLEDVSIGRKTTNIPLWSIIVGLLLLIAAVSLLLLRKKLFVKKEVKTSIDKNNDNSLEIVEEISSHYVCNLNYVQQSLGSYFIMDMQQDFVDTTVHKIFIHHTAIKKMYDFFKQSLEGSDQTNETGCYFIGCWEYDGPDKKSYNISVEDIVEPGDDIVPGEFSFNFGLKIGVKLFARIAELGKTTNRDFVHTVWMHSHPGLGLFLSSHDLLVQKQLTYSDAPGRLVAFVIDTNTPEWNMAVFTAKANGEMNNKEDLKRLYSLESLYKWSRNTRALDSEGHKVMVEVAKPDDPMEDYYTWQVNHQGNQETLNAYVSSHAINAIDDILYNNTGKQVVGGYAVGRMESKGNFTNIVIDDCPTKPVNNSFALMIVDNKIKDSDILTKYVGKKPVCCVIVFKNDEEMLILTRETVQDPFPPLSMAARCPIKPMKDWLRRKRIYK